jgi:anti-repressor protein
MEAFSHISTRDFTPITRRVNISLAAVHSVCNTSPHRISVQHKTDGARMANQVIAQLSAQAASMSSREIAELTGKRHPDVKRDIEKMLADLAEDVSSFARIYLDSMNRQQTEYDLDRELTETLLTGYSAPLRRKVIARWRELETAATVPALPDFTNPAIAARAWAEQFEAKLALSAQIAADAPKVAFAEAIRSIDGVCHIEKVAKTLGYGRNKFFKRLRDDTILMRSNLPYQKYIDREYFTVIEQEPYTDKQGITHPTFTAMVTGAGQVFLARKYSPAALGHAR